MGDALIFVGSLWLALFTRSSVAPSAELFLTHVLAFSPIFILWVLVFFISGLYDKHTTTFKRKLPDVILTSTIICAVIAVGYFYFFFTDTGITPKTNLLLTLVYVIFLISVWRIYLLDIIFLGAPENVFIIGEGESIEDLREEILKNKKFKMNVHLAVSLDDQTMAEIKRVKAKSVIMNLETCRGGGQVPHIYELLFSGVRLIDAEELYENIFDQVPLPLLSDGWFLKNMQDKRMVVYGALKRVMDFSLAFVIGLISLVFYPFVYLAIKLDDGGPVFIVQDRVGESGKLIKIVKFRSMSVNDGGKWVVQNDPRITRVGEFLRKSRIDELPQLWNVLKGDVSLVGPRPELPRFVELYDKEIPYFNMRHLVKPGLSGWAQIHHTKPPNSVEETKSKLAYDLYYIKNRSLALDIEIALKTIKTLILRTGL